MHTLLVFLWFTNLVGIFIYTLMSRWCRVWFKFAIKASKIPIVLSLIVGKSFFLADIIYLSVLFCKFKNFHATTYFIFDCKDPFASKWSFFGWNFINLSHIILLLRIGLFSSLFFLFNSFESFMNIVWNMYFIRGDKNAKFMWKLFINYCITDWVFDARTPFFLGPYNNG